LDYEYQLQRENANVPVFKTVVNCRIVFQKEINPEKPVFISFEGTGYAERLRRGLLDKGVSFCFRLDRVILLYYLNSKITNWENNMVATKKWSIDFSSGVHVYKQIINHIYAAIGNGELKEGDQLPTIKDLANQLDVNPNTVAKAYRDLEMKEVITGRRGNGSFISAPEKTAPKLTSKEKSSRMAQLFGRLLAEAKNDGIMENELMAYIYERIKADENP
jgi:GntR family transcriptional regulator